jgi:hypothetical protein
MHLRGSLLASGSAAVLALFAVGCGRSNLNDLGLGDSGGAGAGLPSSGPGGDGGAGPGPGPGPGGAGSPDGPGPGPGPGPGGGAPCSSPAECNDGDACTSDRCEDGACFFVPRDDDGDGFGPLSCGGADCNDQNAQVNPNQGEVCADGSDNDCNGVADCQDPVCENVPNCGCVPDPSGETCTDGFDQDCDGLVDCFDADCAGTPECGCAQSEQTPFCGDGFDQDCDGAFDCDDGECASDPLCQCQAIPESCDDDQDNDCDGLIDCADTACIGIFPCTCQGAPIPEICNDGFDNDCDGIVDCADPDCFVSPSCDECVSEVCDDGLDNDCDDRIDCADDACVFAPNCTPIPEVCNDAIDNDGDGLVDCFDPDCAANPFCQEEQSSCLTARFIPGSGTYFGDTTGNVPTENGTCGGGAGEAVFFFTLSEATNVHLDTVGSGFDSTLYVRRGSCPDGVEIGCDDDSGGSFAASLDFVALFPGTYFVFVDGYTIDPVGGPNEGPFQLNVVFDTDPEEVCQNGLDDDGNVFVDCADPACLTHPACLNCRGGEPPRPEFGEGRCTNGIDDDCDGTIDCADEDCSASDFYVTECCNGIDANGNGFPNDFNCRCASDDDCPSGQICYDHTSHTCGPPCDQFFGDVCPFVAAGSTCNDATLQCEF